MSTSTKKPVKKDGAKSKRTGRLDNADDPDDEEAVKKLRKGFHATSTTSTRASAVSEYSDFCRHPKRNAEPFPLDINMMERFAAVLSKNGHAATAKTYLSHLRTEARIEHKKVLSEGDAAYLTSVNRSLDRDSASDREDYNPWSLELLQATKDACATRHDRLTHDTLLVQYFTCMRPCERENHAVEFIEDDARFSIPRSKTDQEAVGRHIRLSPRPDSDGFCPVAAARRLATNKFTLSAKEYTRSLARLLELAGIENKQEGRKRCVYSPHGVRKGAAQAFLLAGMERDLVQKVGGWKSRMSLLRYEDEVMLDPKVQPVLCPLKSIKMIEDKQKQAE